MPPSIHWKKQICSEESTSTPLDVTVFRTKNMYPIRRPDLHWRINKNATITFRIMNFIGSVAILIIRRHVEHKNEPIFDKGPSTYYVTSLGGEGGLLSDDI